MEAAVEWLLSSDEPGIRLLAKRDLLDEANPEEESLVLDGPSVHALLDGQRADGGFGVHPYGKWQGAHWRLVSLVELGVPVGEPRCIAAGKRCSTGSPEQAIAAVSAPSTVLCVAVPRRREMPSPCAPASALPTTRASGCSRSP